MPAKILVTGGCGFLGRHVVAELLARDYEVINADKLTYAADPSANAGTRSYALWPIACEKLTPRAELEDITGIIHLAAESHVDNSISAPSETIRANIEAALKILELARFYGVKVMLMSTDEVTGSLKRNDAPTNELSQLRSSSPYSASKAACEHLAQAYRRTYGLNITCVRSTNLFGPYQHPEKFIPRAITYALSGRQPKLYAGGENVRDWLWVEDGARGVVEIFERGVAEVYCLGARNQRKNSDVMGAICAALGVEPESVDDRPGHDLRYATDPSYTDRSLPGWRRHDGAVFDALLTQTVDWYRNNQAWWRAAIERGGRWQ